MQTTLSTMAACAVITTAVMYLAPSNHQGSPTQSSVLAGDTPDNASQRASLREDPTTLIDVHAQLIVAPSQALTNTFKGVSNTAEPMTPVNLAVDINAIAQNVQGVATTKDTHLIASPRLQMQDRSRASIVLSHAMAIADRRIPNASQTQQDDAPIAIASRGFTLHLITAASENRESIGVSLEVLTEWGQDLQDLRPPIGNSNQSETRLNTGWTGGRFQFHTDNGQTTMCPLPLSRSQIAHLVGKKENQLPKDATAALLIAISANENPNPEPSTTSALPAQANTDATTSISNTPLALVTQTDNTSLQPIAEQINPFVQQDPYQNLIDLAARMQGKKNMPKYMDSAALAVTLELLNKEIQVAEKVIDEMIKQKSQSISTNDDTAWIQQRQKHADELKQAHEALKKLKMDIMFRC